MIQTASMVLRNGTRLLLDAIGEGASRDARILMAETLGVAADRLTVELSRTVTPMQVAQFEHLIKRRCKSEPISHIIGRRSFWKHDFDITSEVLDPRPETETLIELALLGRPAASILDMGTGSGCVLISLLDEWPNAKGTGVDVSQNALQVAQSNAEKIGVSDRSEFFVSDWFAGVSGAFDLIVCNPPYISEEEMKTLSVDVREFEPRLALTPEGDGLDAYRIIAKNIGAHLLKGGTALFEIGYQQGKSVVQIFQDHGFDRVTLHQDLNDHDRVVKVYH